MKQNPTFVKMNEDDPQEPIIEDSTNIQQIATFPKIAIGDSSSQDDLERSDFIDDKYRRQSNQNSCFDSTVQENLMNHGEKHEIYQSTSLLEQPEQLHMNDISASQKSVYATNVVSQQSFQILKTEYDDPQKHATQNLESQRKQTMPDINCRSDNDLEMYDLNAPAPADATVYMEGQDDVDISKEQSIDTLRKDNQVEDQQISVNTIKDSALDTQFSGRVTLRQSQVQMGLLGSRNQAQALPKMVSLVDEINEGGENNQITVEPAKNLDLQQINSSRSNSFSDDSSDQSNREGEEAVTPKKNRKGNKKSFCETSIFNNNLYVLFQSLLGLTYFGICITEIYFQAQNQQWLHDNKSEINFISNSQSQPDEFKDFEENLKSVKIIKSLWIVQIVLVVIMIIDFAFKLINFFKVQKANTVPPTITKNDNPLYLNEPLVFDPIKLNGGEFVINGSLIVMDGVMIVAIIVCQAIQATMSSNNTLTYLHVGILCVTRAYLKLPFALVLIQFAMNVKKIKHQANQIFPKQDQQHEFKCYKDKVLFILNSIRNQFGKRVANSQPNFDLAWCQFVIENDYLQISNSISCPVPKQLNYSQQNTAEFDHDKIMNKKRNRRFSKTIQNQFGHRNKVLVDNLVKKEVRQLAIDIVENDKTESTTYNNNGALDNFNTYFTLNAFDAFKIDKAVNGNLLYFTLMYNYHQYDWKNVVPGLDSNKFMNLAYCLQGSYRNNFYHSQIHAADVVQNLCHILFQCNVKEVSKLTSTEIFMTLLSGAAHDMDHPGTNNIFETKSKSKLSILYNDLATLEQHHAASFFFLLENIKHDCNIMADLSETDRNDGRKIILENILGTDMSKHGQVQAEMKAISELPEDCRLLDTKNKGGLLKALVHASDIGNPTRPFDIAKSWAEQIVKEFFGQGDREKSLGYEISYLCDRHTVNFANSQIGFLNFMIHPYFNILNKLIPQLEPLTNQVKDNVEVYKEQKDEYEEYMKQGNTMF